MKESLVLRSVTEERRCAVPGCTECMSDGGALYCAKHARQRGRDTRWRGKTFAFKCANCPFEAELPAKNIKKVYCDDCSETREREREVARRTAKRRADKANAGAAGKAASNGNEGGQATEPRAI